MGCATDTKSDEDLSWRRLTSIWDALEYGRPKRIGHALCLFDDPSLVTYILDHDIHIEFCPTSNLRVGTVKELADHPIYRAIGCGLNFSINTDDPGQFECTLNSEFDLVQPFGALDSSLVFENSRRSAFAFRN